MKANLHIHKRVEREGYVSIFDRVKRTTTFLNDSAEIIHQEILNNDYEFGDLVDKCITYGINQEDIVKTLYELRAKKLIDFNNEEVETALDNKLDNGVYIAGELDYKKISNFIMETFASERQGLIYTVSAQKEYFNQDYIRARQFNNVEYCVFSITKQEIDSVITLSPPQNKLINVGVVTGIFVKANVDIKKKIDLIEKNYEKVMELFSKDIRKVRINVPMIDSVYDYKKLISILEELGFFREALLEGELNPNTDLAMYTKLNINVD
jgi:hypothetical protein